MLVRKGPYFSKLWGMTLVIMCVGAVFFAWMWSTQAPGAPTADVTWAVSAVNGSDLSGFQRATEARPFTFPADHGPHSEYQTEWWYYTGNVQSPNGQQWGYQLTFFRRAVTATPVARSSKWAANNMYMAHFALTDVAGRQFFASDRFARGGELGLAGATGEPYHVFVRDWSARGTGNAATLQATSDRYAINLEVQSLKPAMLQGESANGLSQKSSEVGNASYYYSLPRMQTTGTLTVDGQTYEVSGLSWMDHEWGTSALGAQQTGWDWFALQLSDGRDIMWGQLRRADGSIDVAHGGISSSDGTTMTLHQGDVTVTPVATWTSSTTGATYPVRWQVNIPKADLSLDVEARLVDQELHLASGAYWEGAVRVTGSVEGQGYVELTGYGERLQQQR
jgi:predicted secreted hydrolase